MKGGILGTSPSLIPVDEFEGKKTGDHGLDLREYVVGRGAQ